MKFHLRSVIVLILALLFSACGEQEKKAEKSTRATTPTMQQTVVPQGAIVQSPAHRQTRSPNQPATQQLQPASPRGETPLMQKMGLKVEGSRIILDTRRSKAYFEELGRKLRQSMDQSVKTIRSQSPKGEDLGIYVDQHTIVLDLNKTKKFLENWVDTMEVIGKELEHSLQPPQ
ncbi:hypothetical protein [Nitratifractor sp.]